MTAPGQNLIMWMVYNGEYTVEEVDAAAIYKAGMPWEYLPFQTSQA
ncbi:hypothetical protein KEJ37_05810 [Candidatus Bathyarchaeota archaeon]|nr:hypothetical protein [Candidatus Bathyarchaeota archaeon]